MQQRCFTDLSTRKNDGEKKHAEGLFQNPVRDAVRIDITSTSESQITRDVEYHTGLIFGLRD